MSSYREQVERLALRRAEQMRAMRAKGKTFQEIGDHFEISRQRAHQIVSALLKGAKP